jgi:3-deoxy-D-manno-octulosonic-acid transferase
VLSKSKEAFRRVLLYQALLLIAVFFTLPFWLLAFVFVPKLRAGFWQKCGFISPALEEKLDKLNRNQPVLWIHAVSVGELLAVKPLIHLLLEQNITVVISTTTKTGQTLAQADLGNQCVVLYFPYDAFFAVNPLVKAIRPDLVMIMETELWPYFIWYIGHRSATALYLINGRLSDKSFLGYQKIKRFLRPILSLLDHAYMQTKLDAQRFKSLLLPHAINKVSVLGNLKFDLPPWHERQDKIQHLKKLFNFPKDSTVITVASTHEGEEALLLNVLYELGRDFPELRIVVVPRHPERIPQVSRLLREETFRFRLRSSLSEASLNTEKTVLVDSIGELKDILAFSDMAIVAGSFLPHLGGHNILEPIMVGTPVLYGPYMSNFKEIVYTVEQHEAGIQAQDALALKHAIVELMTNTSERERLVKAGYVMLAAHQGQTHSLVEAVLKQLHWHAV